MVPAYYDNRRDRRHRKDLTMDLPPVINEAFVLVHLVGMAILVGSFILKMRAKSDYPFTLMIWGASIQLVTGTILVGLTYMSGDAPDNLKITVKFLLAAGALVAAILGSSRQKKGEAKLQPFFHAAGGLAFISLIIAVLWDAELYV